MEYVAILVASVASFVVGFGWYALFGKQWMKMMGITKAQMEKGKQMNMTPYYFGQIVSVVVQVSILSWLLALTGRTTLYGGLCTASTLWLGFVAVESFSQVLWEGRTLKLWAFNNAQRLLSLLVIAAILVLWP